MNEEVRIEDLTGLLTQSNVPESKIIEVLTSIIKQQLMYGGSLADKITFCIEEVKKPL